MDLHRLTQVMMNLVLNAVQAMPGGGTLRVRCRPVPGTDGGPGWGEIVFTDTGPGVTLEDRESVFRPFFTTKSSGTGLGLSIARRLVTEHGGGLSLDPSEGSGSVFRVRLPLADS
jgi:two-component system NtrC family sensor kinase